MRAIAFATPARSVGSQVPSCSSRVLYGGRGCVFLRPATDVRKNATSSGVGRGVIGQFRHRAQTERYRGSPGTVILGNGADIFSCHPRDCAGQPPAGGALPSRRSRPKWPDGSVCSAAGGSSRDHSAGIGSAASVFGGLRRLALQREDQLGSTYELRRRPCRFNARVRPDLRLLAHQRAFLSMCGISTAAIHDHAR